MDGVSKAEVINFLKSLNLPESKFLVGGEIIDIYTLLGIEPQFNKDGTRVLTPYEIIDLPPQFSSDGKEVPIVFVIKNRCKKIGRYEGKTKDFVCKNNKVKDSRDTLEELKIKYKRAVLNGDEDSANELFKMIDKLSGGNAKDLLSSFFNYAKFYKKMQKQLLIDMFAHFFMMYIYARVKAAKGGIVRKNRIYKPFKTAFVQTQTVMPNQNVVGQISDMQINQTPVQVETPKVEVVSVSSMEEDGFSPESFGIKNLKSITIEHNMPVVEEVVEAQVETMPITPIMPITSVINTEEVINEKPVETVVKSKKQPSNGELVKKESKGIIESMVDFFTLNDNEEDLVDYSSNSFSENDLEMGENSQINNDYQISETSVSYGESDNLENELGENVEPYAMPKDNNLDQESNAESSFSENEEDDDGEVQKETEIERSSELKSKKHITVKKYGVEFNTETKETKVEKEAEADFGKEYDFEG